MKALEAIVKKFSIDPAQYNGRMPIDLFHATRNDLADLFGELEFKSGAEIGVESGLYSEVLAKANPTAKLYLIDSWKAYSGYRDHVTQSKMDGFYENAKTRMSEYNAEIIRGFSMDIVKQFVPNSLDWVYIDGNHAWEYVTQDIIEWSKRVKSGGIVSGHDYIRRRNIRDKVHVIQAIHGFTYSNNISPWFTVGGASKEIRSWLFIKP